MPIPKSKFSPSPETIKLNTTYGFNLNIDEKLLYRKSFPQQYEIYLLKLQELQHSQVKIVCYPEISKKGKLHLHGYIVFYTNLSISEFYLQLLNYPHHLYIHEINDYDAREIYILKSEFIMRPLCEKYNKPYKIKIHPKTIAPILKSFYPKDEL